MILLRSVVRASLAGLALAAAAVALLLLPGPRPHGPSGDRFPLWEQPRIRAVERLIDQDRRLEARRSLERLAERHPGSAWVQLRLAEILERLGRNGEAVAALDRAADLSDAVRADARVKYLKARLLARDGRAEEALGAAVTAARSPRAPDGAAALAARLLRDADRSAEAAELLRFAIRRGATGAGVWRETGTLRAEAGEASRAADAFSRALRADPCDLETLEAAARLERSRGDLDAALAHAERVVECSGDMSLRARLFLLRAHLHLEAGSADRALASLSSALEAGYDGDEWSREDSAFFRAFPQRPEFRMLLERYGPDPGRAAPETRRDG